MSRPSKPPSVSGAAAASRADVHRVDSDRAQEFHGAPFRGERTQRVLAERAHRADVSHAEYTEERADCTRVLAEQRGALRRGSTERLATASLLDEVLSKRAERGDESCSTRAVAHRCKTNPRVLHEYRHAEKLAPWALAWVLPIEVVEEINESIMAKRGAGRSWRWAVGLVRRGIDWIEELGVRADDRDEASAALLALQSRLVRAIARVNQEGPR